LPPYLAALLQAAAVSGGRLLAVFTVQMDANEDITNFPIIYTMGPVSNGVLQPHSVRAAHLSLECASLLQRSIPLPK
jgi:hypothetical protein